MPQIFIHFPNKTISERIKTVYSYAAQIIQRKYTLIITKSQNRNNQKVVHTFFYKVHVLNFQ